MTPDVDERIASVVRALTDVVLPSLPNEAGLAREQVQLSIGQLQILRGQIDNSLAFEAEELADARALGEELVELGAGEALADQLSAVRDVRNAADIRAARVAIHGAIHDLMPVVSKNSGMVRALMAAERLRVIKDRAWFASFGLDSAPPEV